MMLSRLKGLSMVLVLVALTSVGCCTKFKKEISGLQRKQDDLIALKSKAEADLSKALTNEQAARSQLGTVQTTLSQADAKIQDLEAKIASGAKGNGVILPRRNGGVRGETTVYKHTVESDVLFMSGKATLTARGKDALASVIAKIKSSYPANTVRVYGHTDSDPIVKTKKLWADNLDLSANRAMAVTRYLILKKISRSRIETVAMGASRPIADNKTKAGKAKNRRVEIVVVK